MNARNKKSAVAQGSDSSAFERAAVVIALSFLAPASVGPDLHQFLADRMGSPRPLKTILLKPRE
jgi:hypothetical protein